MLQLIACLQHQKCVAYNMNKRRNSMNDLNCKVCDTPTGNNHDDDVVAVTCSICSMVDIVSLLNDMDTGIVGEA